MNFEFNTLTLLILFGVGAIGLLFCHTRISEASRETRETSIRMQENLERRLIEINDRFSGETRGLRESVLSINDRTSRFLDEVNDTMEEARKRILQEAETGKEDLEKRLSFFGDIVESTKKELLSEIEEKSRRAAEQNAKTQESLRGLSLETERLAGISRNLPDDTGERLVLVEKLFQGQVDRISSLEEAANRDREEAGELSSRVTARLGALEKDLRGHFENRLDEFSLQVNGALQKTDELDTQIKNLYGTVQDVEKLSREPAERIASLQEAALLDREEAGKRSAELAARLGILEKDLRDHFESRLDEFCRQVDGTLQKAGELGTQVRELSGNVRDMEKLLAEPAARISSLEETVRLDHDEVRELSSGLAAQFGALEKDLRIHFENRLNEFYQQVNVALQKTDELGMQVKGLSGNVRDVEKLFKGPVERIASLEEAARRDREETRELSSEIVSQFGSLEKDLRIHFESRLSEFYQQINGALQKTDELDLQVQGLAGAMRDTVRENLQNVTGRIFALIGKMSEETLADDALALAGFKAKPDVEPPAPATAEEKPAGNRFSHLFKR